MEKLKDMHKHALTQWLKVIIFGILLLAPFFSVLSRCLYVTCNKNANESYSGSEIVYKRVRKNLPSGDTLQVNHYYYLDEIDYDTLVSEMNFNGNMTFTILEGWIYVNNRFSYYTINTNTYAEYYIDATGETDTLTIYEPNYNIWDDCFPTIKGVLLLIDINVPNDVLEHLNETDLFEDVNNFQLDFLYEYQETEVSYLDNVFEYSVNELNNTPIFNWVQNTAIYTPINAMTNGLGFTENNNVLALLLTYWTLLTCVYVVFDIVIACFVKITHMVIE